jgi:hypothetical protein
VEIEASDGIDDGLRGHVDDQIISQPSLQRLVRGCSQQNGLYGEGGKAPGKTNQALDHQASLGHEEAVGVQPLRIADVTIRIQARIVIALDGGNHWSV